MITRIEITNFMAHRHTVIEPAAGLTVLVGPNNVGKSAVVAALQILCQNESAAYVMRHGERECVVGVQTDDGHSVQWRRKGSSQSYVIDGQVFDRLKGKIPDELHQALRLPTVDAESEADFDVHFGTQKSPVFLLNSPAANRARFFASSSDAIQLVAMQKRHKEKLTDAQREKSHLEKESKELNEELAFLEPVSDLDQRVKNAEHEYNEIVRFDGWLKEAEKHERAWEGQIAEVVRHREYAATLSELPEPPVLVDIRPLERLIAAITEAAYECESESSRVDALLILAAPPELAKTEPLAELIQSLEAAASRRSSFSASVKALRDLSNPPPLADTEDLGRIICRLAASTRELQMATGELSALQAAAPPPGLLDEAPLAVLVASLTKTLSQRNAWKSAFSALAEIKSPPTPIDLEDLSKAVVQLDLSAEDVRSCQAKAAAAERELGQAAAELRMQVDGSECPICGNILDADAVLARAAAGLGGHALA